MTDQELITALSRLGYKSEPTEDGLVRIYVEPADFIRGAPKLRNDLQAVGWRRSYAYRAARPLTIEERKAWDRFLRPLEYLEIEKPKPKPKPKKEPAAYIQLSLFD